MRNLRFFAGGLAAIAALAVPLGTAAFLIIQPTSGAPVPDAEWLLNTASISGTTVADASGHGNTALVIAGPLTFGTNGANFNGTTQALQQQTMFLSVRPVATWAVWAKYTSSPLGITVLASNSDTSSELTGFWFGTGGTDLVCHIGNGSNIGTSQFAHTISAGVWTHFACVYDGAAVRIYKNGAQLATAAFAGGNIATTVSYYAVARNAGTGDQWFQGELADVRTYYAALSTANVLALFNAGVPPP
jgi:Concanavalin A-like lectin/glucanases superfamily